MDSGLNVLGSCSFVPIGGVSVGDEGSVGLATVLVGATVGVGGSGNSLWYKLFSMIRVGVGI